MLCNEEMRKSILSRLQGYRYEHSLGVERAAIMLAEKYGCAFVDGSAVTAAKCSDQIHLTAEEHAMLGRLIADKLRKLL